jgi:hypothetical protein
MTSRHGRGAAARFVAILLLAVTASCRRDYSREIGPLPSPLVATAGAPPDDAPTAPATASADGGAPGPRPLGRKPLPVFFRGHDVGGNFARLAPPSSEYPRGTIGVLVDEGGVYADDGRPTGPWQRYFLELDLATGAPVRTLPVVKTADRAELYDGASGPILFLWGPAGATVIWFDRKLDEVTRHSFNVPHGEDVTMCGETSVGDRFVLALCDGPHTPLWVLGEDGTAIVRTCPQRTSDNLMTIAAWHDDRVALLVEGAVSACAFRLDGKGGVLTRQYGQPTVFVLHGNEILLAVGTERPRPRGFSIAFYTMGDDLRPQGPPRPEPERAPEEVAASALLLHVERMTVTLVSGTIVITGINCCGGYSPTHLWLLDPHAGD